MANNVKKPMMIMPATEALLRIRRHQAPGQAAAGAADIHIEIGNWLTGVSCLQFQSWIYLPIPPAECVDQ